MPDPWVKIGLFARISTEGMLAGNGADPGPSNDFAVVMKNPGARGNSFSLHVTVDVQPSLTVELLGTEIRVHAHFSGGGGANNDTTAQQAVDALNANSQISALVRATLIGTGVDIIGDFNKQLAGGGG